MSGMLNGPDGGIVPALYFRSDCDGFHMSYVSRDFSAELGRDILASELDPPRSIYGRFGKRELDFLLVVLAAPLILVVVLVCAAAIRLEGGPVFFRQKRLGRGGRVFDVLKLRTMVVDAEQKLEQYLAANPAAREEWDRTQKLKRDPRVTRVGRFLRRTSFDELPQMWNVLVGDMSLVGPRPMTVDQGPLYPGTAYYAVRPGITGPWQVSDRNNCSFAGRAKYDADYEADLSFATDLSILLRTVSVVVRGTGY